MIKISPQLRSGRQGDGRFGARRGSRTHNGIDYVTQPGDRICSPVAGVITKHGYPYRDDLSYRYVEITTQYFDTLDTSTTTETHIQIIPARHRLFYTLMFDTLKIGDTVHQNDIVGIAQDIAARYPAKDPKDAMINHVHYEIKRPDGTYINPEQYLYES